jgi:hypothetical protein
MSPRVRNYLILKLASSIKLNLLRIRREEGHRSSLYSAVLFLPGKEELEDPGAWLQLLSIRPNWCGGAVQRGRFLEPTDPPESARFPEWDDHSHFRAMWLLGRLQGLPAWRFLIF